jgi:hypothetical protein
MRHYWQRWKVREYHPSLVRKRTSLLGFTRSGVSIGVSVRRRNKHFDLIGGTLFAEMAGTERYRDTMM